MIIKINFLFSWWQAGISDIILLMNAEKLKELVDSTEGEVHSALSTLISTCAKLSLEKRGLEEHNATISEMVRNLRKKLYGSSSEQLKNTHIPEQMHCDLFNEFELVALEPLNDDDADSVPEVPRLQKRKSLAEKVCLKHYPASL